MQSATQLSHKMRRTRTGSPAAADALGGVLFDSFLWKRCAAILWLALLAVLAPYSAQAATLPGTIISNIASATYTSGSISGLGVSSNTNTLLVVSSIDQGSLNISSATATVWAGTSTHVSITATNTGSNLLASGTLAVTAPAGATIVFDGGLVPTVTGNQYSVPLPNIPISSSTGIGYTLTLPLNQISGNLDLPVTFTANSTTVTVGTLSLVARARTAITTEFLRYDPTNSTAPVQVPTTQYDTTGGGVFALIPPPVLPGSANLVTFQPISLIPAASFRKGEIMFVRVTDADQNLDSGAVDTVTINLNGSLTNDQEILRLSETGVNTGVFLGYILASPEAPQLWNGRLSVQASSVATTLYTDNVDLSTGTASVLVDPYGRVFDSRTGQALNGISVTLVNANTGLPAVVFGDDGVSIYPLYVSFCWTWISILLVNFVRPGTAVRLALGTPSPWESKERRAGFSLITRTVAWANKPAFLQGWVP